VRSGFGVFTIHLKWLEPGCKGDRIDKSWSMLLSEMRSRPRGSGPVQVKQHGTDGETKGAG
jgi:hypothetical protein